MRYWWPFVVIAVVTLAVASLLIYASIHADDDAERDRVDPEKLCQIVGC